MKGKKKGRKQGRKAKKKKQGRKARKEARKTVAAAADVQPVELPGANEDFEPQEKVFVNVGHDPFVELLRELQRDLGYSSSIYSVKMDVLVQHTQSVVIFQYKYPVSRGIPVQHNQSVGIFQYNIFSQCGCSRSKFSVSRDIRVQIYSQ